MKSLALVLTRHQQAFCSMAAHFRQILPAESEIPSPCFNAVVAGFLLDGGSLPPDFARGFCAIPSPCINAVRAGLLLGDGFTAPSARFCQQVCEIPSPCFNAVFTDHSSLPPDFASRFVRSLALVLTRSQQVFCS